MERRLDEVKDPDLCDLWAAIIAEPEDDALRLIYADRILDLGDERLFTLAEFIRVQVEMANGPASCGNPTDNPHRCFDFPERCRRHALISAEKSLWQQHVPTADDYGLSIREWCYEDGRGCTEAITEMRWIRGFPGEVKMTAAEFLRVGGRLAADLPLTRVVLKDRGPTHLGSFGSSPRYGWAVTRHRDGYVPMEFDGGGDIICDSPEAALAEISARCLRWARSKNRG